MSVKLGTEAKLSRFAIALQRNRPTPVKPAARADKRTSEGTGLKQPPAKSATLAATFLAGREAKLHSAEAGGLVEAARVAASTGVNVHVPRPRGPLGASAAAFAHQVNVARVGPEAAAFLKTRGLVDGQLHIAARRSAAEKARARENAAAVRIQGSRA